MITILGAGGAVSNELVQLLLAHQKPFRLVSRRGGAAPRGAESMAADLTDKDQAIRAVAGSSIVFLVIGLPYDHRVWAEMWPKIMANTIEACKRAHARLVFFDNVYMYGKVAGAMTETTPFHPMSKKGEVRAKIASSLIEEWRFGRLTAMIARAADFYGPHTANGVANVLVFDPLSKGEKAMCLASDQMPHSYTYIPDTAPALMKLAETESAWNQTWHLPTAPDPPTSRQLIAMAAKAMGKPFEYRVLNRTTVRVFGWFKPVVGEVREMMYQNDAPYLFDSTKYATAFGFSGTPYAEGIAATAESYRAG